VMETDPYVIIHLILVWLSHHCIAIWQVQNPAVFRRRQIPNVLSR